MNAEDRATLLDSARYLRGVRPVEPAELADYVDTHPAVVRRLLQDHAVDLELVERPDGTFAPVEETPVPGEVGVVRRLPAAYDRRLGDLLADEYGPEWYAGASGDRLRERVRRLKDDYYRDREVTYDREAALGYAVYHLPDFYAAVQYAVDLVADLGLLDRRLRVLDVGAGVGGPALGLHDFLFGPPTGERAGDTAALGADPGGTSGEDDDGDPPTDRPRDPAAALVDYHAVEPSAAADVLTDLLEETGQNFHATVHRTTAEAFDPATAADGDDAAPENGETTDADDGASDGDGPAGYDLVLFANVLNELDDPVTTLRRYLSHLAPHGTLVALAPADRETSVGLRRAERAVVDGADDPQSPAVDPGSVTAFAPEVRLWPGRAPTDQGWSFDERPALTATRTQRRLDRPAGGEGEFRKTAVRYTPSLLRLDGRTRVRVVPDEDRVAPMADAEAYVTERVDLVGVKLSRSLSEGDANPLFRVGDGSQGADHYAVLTRETALNRALRRAAFGDAVLFDGALALYNDDEDAYNLVVDDETVVDRIPPG